MLIAAPPGAPLLERAAAIGVPTHALKLSGSFDPLGALRLAKLLQRERPDVLHLHDGHAILPGRWAARALPRESLSGETVSEMGMRRPSLVTRVVSK